MRHICYSVSCALLLTAVPASAQYDDPRAAAQKVADEAMAKALAEKARNDAIVEQQRAAEREKAKAKPTPAPKKGSVTPQ